MTKDENIVIRVESETKAEIQKMASARQMSISQFLLGLISDGARLERERRERVRGLVSKMGAI